jgi:carbonic anhydrase
MALRLALTAPLAAALFLASAPAVQAGGHKKAESAAQTKASQADLTPAEALALLKEGHERFLAGTMHDRDLHAQVHATASGQYPHSVVLGCIDSRVPPEIVLDQGIGDIFTPRIAGNFANTDILGSMEFATGAVMGAADGVELGNLTHTLSNLTPAIYAVDGHDGERTSKNITFVNAVAEENVQQTVQNILDRSPVMKNLVDEGKLLVVGAMHDVATGQITWYD